MFTCRFTKVTLSVLFITCLTPGVCWAGAGDLDPTFGVGGLVTTDFLGPDQDYGRDVVAVQADGKIVVVGHIRSGSPTSWDFALARYNDDGSLDTSFGIDGTVTTDFAALHDYAYSVAVQDDGKIVVAGSSYQPGTGNDFALARYNYDGTLDSSFGSGGLVTTHFGYSHDYAQAVAIQANGQIVVAGYSYQPGTGIDFALARYNTDGSLDSSFGSGGLVTTHSSSDYSYAVAIQADAKIVVSGYTYSGSPTGWDFALARYDTDGSLDSSFGSGGLVTTHFGSTQDFAYAMAIQGDGKIVAAGRSIQPGTGQDFALARYNLDGSLDTNFGVSGLVTTHFGSSSDQAYGVAIQADGKIVAAGVSSQGATLQDFALARYYTNGDLDGSFGSGGFVTTAFTTVPTSSDVAFGVAIDVDGNIVLAGYSNSPVATGYDFALARYDTYGSLDAAFGNGGLVTTDFAGSYDAASGVLIQADGKIVLAGWTNTGAPTYNDFALARYNPDGSLDSSFGTGGLVTTHFAGSNSDYAYAMAIQGDGKIVAAGGSSQPGTGGDFALARYDTYGNLDTSFGSGGLVTTDFAGSYDESSGVAIQADGKIVVSGSAYSGYPTYWDFALARYNTDGSLDSSFGTGGLVTTDFASNSDSGYGVALQSDGRIVVAGESIQPGTGYDFVMARYDTDGSLDSSFGSGGLVTTDFAGSYDGAYAVAIQADGKIILAGGSNSGPPTGDNLALARYEGVADPDALIELLILEIQNLVSLGVLNNGQGNSLLVKLQGAIQKLDAEQTDTAINKLEAFINQINAFVEAGILTPAEGEAFVDAATLIVELLL